MSCWIDCPVRLHTLLIETTGDSEAAMNIAFASSGSWRPVELAGALGSQNQSVCGVRSNGRARCWGIEAALAAL